MNAKEYFEKYGEDIWEEAHDPKIRRDGPMAKMFIAFSVEVKEIIKERNVKTDDGLMGIIRSQNQKWNAVVNLFVKQYGVSPIKRDGFWTGWCEQLGIVGGKP